MIQASSKPPTNQRTFANGWSELNYLCEKIRFWLYDRRQRYRAEHYSNRLKQVLRDLPPNDMAIIREEGLALFFELEGNLDKAIAHRKREIKLMERLQREARSPRYAEATRTYLLRHRDATTLRDRQTVLQALLKANA